MSTKRNRRNTRRGRKKRWRHEGVGLWFCHGGHGLGYVFPRHSGGWAATFRAPGVYRTAEAHNRTAAMRLVERMAAALGAV